MKVAFVSGTSIVNSTLFSSWAVRTQETAYGPVTYKTHGEHALINRHGYGFPLPPHSINYRANFRALADLGFRDIVSLNSVGSLNPQIPPGSIISCADYVCLQQGPATFFDTAVSYTHLSRWAPPRFQGPQAAAGGHSLPAESRRSGTWFRRRPSTKRSAARIRSKTAPRGRPGDGRPGNALSLIHI